MTKRSLFLYFLLLVGMAGFSQRIMENLSRGLVAVKTSSNSVFLSWRLLGSDTHNTAFNLYRNGVKLNQEPLTGATNYTDATASASSYTVKTVVDGVETGESSTAQVLTTNYFDIPLRVPAGMTMPDASTCTYSPNDCSTGDLDGDGNLDLVVKWDPSNAKDNSQSGYTGNVYLDGYKLDGTFLFRIDLGKNIRAGAHYTQFQVADYDGDGRAEIVCKTAPGTKDGKGNFISKGPAATATHSADYRNSGGYILSGPEYLTVFSGATGEELATVNYTPARGTVSSWGDNYGNRVDRFLAGTAWLDGVLPSIIMCRGYYTRAVVAAWNFRNGALTPVWTYDSGNSNVGLYGQGNHNMSIGDVDDDGFDEIIWGAGALDHDGKLMYRTGHGHGDAMHLSDLDPDRKGLEVWTVHESSGAAYGEEMHDARTGTVIWGNYTGTDVGRGLAANIVAGNRGFEMWSSGSSGIKNKNGVVVNSSRPSMNFRIYWDGDLESELLDGTSITKYNAGTLLSASGCSSNNGTKSTPNLSADLIGDWREEVVFRTSDNTRLRVFTTTIPTSVRLYTLMHDPVYRASIAWQNTAYNQPPHAGFYMGSDMETPPASPVYNRQKRWSNGAAWDANGTQAWKDANGQSADFRQQEAVLFDYTTLSDAMVTLSGTLMPSDILVNSTYTVEWLGSGTVTGSTALKKLGNGALILRQNNSHSGATTIWNGALFNNGILSDSKVFVQPFATLGGNGTFGQPVELRHLSTLEIGQHTGDVARMQLEKDLTIPGNATLNFDVQLSGNKVIAHDTLVIKGDFRFSPATSVIIRTGTYSLVAGSYPLIACSGKVEGELSKLIVEGVPAYLSYNLVNSNGLITLNVAAPAMLTWTGAIDNRWDNGVTSNWKFDTQVRGFKGNDSVLFNDDGQVRTVYVSENVLPAHVSVEADANYTFSGTGAIGGTGGITKKGTGTLLISNTNSFTGPVVIEGGSIATNTITNGGVASPLGAASNSASNLILNGGKLTYSGITSTTDRAISLGINGGGIAVSNSSSVLATGTISGPGRLTKEGPGRLSFAAANSYKGGTTIAGGSIGLLNDVANSAGLSSGDTITLMGGSISMFNSPETDNVSTWNLKIPSGSTGSLIVDGRSYINGSITGEGTLNYFTPSTANVLMADASAFKGTINVTASPSGGSFLVYNTKGYGNSRIVLNNYVTMMYPATATITLPIGELAGTSRSELGAGGTGNAVITWEIGGRNTSSTFQGVISNTQYSNTGARAAIRKVGTGALTLTNTNSYSGGTAIAGGELMVNSTDGSGTGTGPVTVMGNGRLSGSGTVGGAVIVEAGGELAPGAPTGSLTLEKGAEILAGGMLSFDIHPATGGNDRLVLGDTLKMKGILRIVTTGDTELAAGNEFQLVNGPIGGLPASISPMYPGAGLAWDLSDFEKAGIVRVTTGSGIETVSARVQLYPNPVQDVLQVKFGQPVSQVKVHVISATGARLMSEEFRGAEMIRLNVSSLQAGPYFIQIQTNDFTTTERIIKR